MSGELRPELLPLMTGNIAYAVVLSTAFCVAATRVPCKVDCSAVGVTLLLIAVRMKECL